MGAVYSYFTDYEKRIQNLEKIIVEMNQQMGRLQSNVREMKSYLEEQKMMFQWDGSTCLYDPKKVMEFQMDNQPSKELDQEMGKFKTIKEFATHKGFENQEELNAYVDSKIKYRFSVHYGPLYYTRVIDNKEEADEFKARFSKWMGRPL